MSQRVIDRAIQLMERRRFGDALPLLRLAIRENPSAWNLWYMAGQCSRFLNDIDGAVEHLTRAAELKADEASVFLALGIALQLRTQWDDAIEALRRAIEIDSEFELAYNSLALTYKKCREHTKALHTYDAGLNALARHIVNAMRNSRRSPILKYRDTAGHLWVEQAIYAATYLASSAGIQNAAWPTGEQASAEERTEAHAGLYWVDMLNDKHETVRLFLPNYFNTFRETLRRDASYSNLIGNRGTILELLGRHDEATQYYDEATEFLP